MFVKHNAQPHPHPLSPPPSPSHRTARLSKQNVKVEKGHNSYKSNPKFTKIKSGHLHIGPKLLAKFHVPNSNGSLDILLTRKTWRSDQRTGKSRAICPPNFF